VKAPVRSYSMIPTRARRRPSETSLFHDVNIPRACPDDDERKAPPFSEVAAPALISRGEIGDFPPKWPKKAISGLPEAPFPNPGFRT